MDGESDPVDVADNNNMDTNLTEQTVTDDGNFISGDSINLSSDFSALGSDSDVHEGSLETGNDSDVLENTLASGSDSDVRETFKDAVDNDFVALEKINDALESKSKVHETCSITENSYHDVSTKCVIHNKQTIVFRCHTCQMNICSICFVNKCKSYDHKVTDICTAMTHTQRDLERRCQRIKKLSFEKMVTKLKKLRDKRHMGCTATKEAKAAVDHAFNEIIRDVMEAKTSYMSLLEDNDEKIMHKLDEVEAPLSKCKDEFMISVLEIHEQLKKNPGIGVFELEREIKDIEDNINRCLASTVPILQLPTYSVPDFDVVRASLGKITLKMDTILGYSEKAIRERETILEDTGILSICPCGGERAMVLSYYQERAKLWDIDQTGDHTYVHRLSFKGSPSNMSLTNQHVLVAIPNEKRVICVSTDNETSTEACHQTYIQTGDLMPFGLAALSPNTVWVGLVDKFGFDRDPYSRRLIACYKETQQEYVIEYNENGRPIFTIPRRMAVCAKSNNVATVNWVSKDEGEIILTNSKGDLVAVYPTDSQNDLASGGKIYPMFRRSLFSFSFNKIHPMDIAFNQLGDIIFCDKQSKSVTILDNQCREVLQIYKELDSVALGCLHNEDMTLWLGGQNGKISIFKYITSKRYGENE